MNNFAEKVIAYIFEENPARLEYDIRSAMARHIMRMVKEELTKEDAYRLVNFASAVARKYPPPTMEEEAGAEEADPE